MWMNFCEFATVHPDGTLTMVRGGLSVWKFPVFPATVNVWVVAQVPARSLGNEQYPLILTIADAAPKPIIWTLDALLQVDNSNVPCNLTLPVSVALPSPGRYRALLQVGPITTDYYFNVLGENT
jgi:hypothetical protein